MNWYTIKKQFNQNFPNYKVLVRPPCISPSRETHYIYDGMAIALGLREQTKSSVSVIVDHENKVVLVLR